MLGPTDHNGQCSYVDRGDGQVGKGRILWCYENGQALTCLSRSRSRSQGHAEASDSDHAVTRKKKLFHSHRAIAAFSMTYKIF